MAAINIMTMNTTSLKARERRQEADQFVKDEKVDVILIQETHLNEKHTLKFANMQVYRNDDGVGTAIGILDKYKSERVRVDSLKTVVVAAAKIKRQNETIVVMSVYVPCGALRCEVAEDLKTIGEKCDEFDWCILGGDWNARNVRWNETNDGVTNVNGKELAKWIDENEEVILISTKENTFRNETKLDHFVISKGMESRATLERRITGKCHDAVKMRWSIEKRELVRTEYEVKKSYKNMDWADFRRRITTKLAHKVKLPKCRNISNDEIDTAIKEITEIILETESECTKRIVVRAANSVELSDEVKGLMKRRRIAITEKRRVNASEEWK